MVGPIVSDKRLKTILSNYYQMLGARGYVNPAAVDRIIIYLFLLDFIDSFAYFINDKDYDLINKVYRRIFSDGCCLMPYPVFNTKRATMGLSTLMGDFRFRWTEEDSEDTSRITEEDINRIF